jgi:uncharacterized membrane protein
MAPLSISPLLAAPVAIQIHAFAALAAFALGTYLLNGRKGVQVHRVLGWTWAGLMLAVAISSLWISGAGPRLAGPFGPIHLLTLLVLAMLPAGLYMARSHRASAHAKFMRGLFWGALVIAGGFTFLPGRIMHAVAFGG